MDSQTPTVAPGLQLVQSYGPGGFTVSGVRHAGSILIFPDRVEAWAVAERAALDLAAFAPVQGAQPVPDILVVGLGAEFALFPPALRQAIRAWGPVVEAMATPAACRTYNILLAEQRRVAAALIALPAA